MSIHLLSATSINTHIPALRSRGVEILLAVSVPDANLRTVIEDRFGKARGAPITRDDMANLTGLVAPNANISDLTGLEFATRLTVLDLGVERVSDRWVNSNEISDLSLLSGLTSLGWLSLSGNSISDVSALSNLTSLERLFLHTNSISDVSALSGLTSLKVLDLYTNSISDVSALSNLTSMRWLSLSGNSISDVSALSNLTSLERLDLYSNSISDVSALSNLTSMRWLFLYSNSISDVSALSNLTSLEVLDLASNSISDVSALSNLTSLAVLWLSSNSISDVSALSNLTSMRWLDLGTNSILDLSPLVTNRGLGRGDLVDVSNNPLSATSINTHIPALQSRWVEVRFGVSKPAVEEKERGIIREEWETKDYISRGRMEWKIK